MNTSYISQELLSNYLKISVLLIGIMQGINIILSCLLILTIILYRPLRTIPNLLTANSSFAIFIYSVLYLAQVVVGLQPQEDRNDDLCIFLSYFTITGTDAVCYSYLVTAISQYFFTILYRRKYLLTFRIHYLLIFLSWTVSCLVPLVLYFSGILQYSSEMHICSLATTISWVLCVYMGIAIGISFFGIIGIYVYIVRHTRRISTAATVITTSLVTSNRDLHVLKHVLTLVSILGTAGLASLALIIWNAFSSGEVPTLFYFVVRFTVSFCTNIQISFIFAVSKNVRVVLRNYVRRIFH